MALALNTSHPLHGNVKLLIGVDEGDVLVDLVTPGRTITPQSGSSFGSGTYGRHFRFGGAQYTPAGAIFDAFTADNTGTLVCVWNGLPYVQTDTRDMQFIIGRGGAAPTARWFPQIHRGNNGRVGAICYDSSIGNYMRAEASTTAFATGGPARMVTITRDGETAHKIYVGSTEEASGGKLGTNNASSVFDRLGGYPGQSAISADLVWAVWFDVVLTPTQVADLYASLGADNAFALIAAGDSTAPVLSSPTGTQTGSTTANVGATTDENNGTLYAVVTTSATQPSVAQIKAGQDHTAAAAAWAGSQAVSTTGAKTLGAAGLTASTSYYAHLVHTDAAANDSNRVSSGQFTTAAPNAQPTFDGPSIPDAGTKKGQALTPLDVSGRYTDDGALTFSPVGTWPAGVTVSSAGVISGTPTQVGTFAGLAVRATDTGSQTVDSNSFTITVSQAVINLGAAGMQLGAAVGSDIADFAVEAGKAFTVAVYADALPFGSSLASASGSTTSGTGYLPNVADDDLSYGTTYYIVGRRESDGESFITRAVAT